jgi:hypothetical protein
MLVNLWITPGGLKSTRCKWGPGFDPLRPVQKNTPNFPLVRFVSNIAGRGVTMGVTVVTD